MYYPALFDIVVLQNATFRMQVTATQSGGTPINLSGYTIDSDICANLTNEIIASFVPVITNAASGIFEVTLPPNVSSGIETGLYRYDVSATQAGGDRYYWLKGAVTVSGTCSRN